MFSDFSKKLLAIRSIKYLHVYRPTDNILYFDNVFRDKNVVKVSNNITFTNSDIRMLIRYYIFIYKYCYNMCIAKKILSDTSVFLWEHKYHDTAKTLASFYSIFSYSKSQMSYCIVPYDSDKTYNMIVTMLYDIMMSKTVKQLKNRLSINCIDIVYTMYEVIESNIVPYFITDNSNTNNLIKCLEPLAALHNELDYTVDFFKKYKYMQLKCAKKSYAITMHFTKKLFPNISIENCIREKLRLPKYSVLLTVKTQYPELDIELIYIATKYSILTDIRKNFKLYAQAPSRASRIEYTSQVNLSSGWEASLSIYTGNLKAFANAKAVTVRRRYAEILSVVNIEKFNKISDNKKLPIVSYLKFSRERNKPGKLTEISYEELLNFEEKGVNT